MISVIIPTFRRPVSVVAHTLDSILSDGEAVGLISEIVLIDQNTPVLDFSATSFSSSMVRVNAGANPTASPDRITGGGPQLVHIHGLAPSVTRAKNFGFSFTTGKYLVFFDDDVTVLPGCIGSYAKAFDEHPEIGFIGGRETLDQQVKQESRLRNYLRQILQGDPTYEAEYRTQGMYVGRIKSNSFMLKNFDLPSDRLVRIDGARGCNWACRREWFERAGGFDPAFQGTALREETDLYLRLGKLGAKGYYNANSRVIHHRQAGGCENLAASLTSLRSKLENERYFQNKHFPTVSRLWFLLRTAPLMLEALRESRGMSLLLWIRYGLMRR